MVIFKNSFGHLAVSFPTRPKVCFFPSRVKDCCRLGCAGLFQVGQGWPIYEANWKVHGKQQSEREQQADALKSFHQLPPSACLSPCHFSWLYNPARQQPVFSSSGAGERKYCCCRHHLLHNIRLLRIAARWGSKGRAAMQSGVCPSLMHGLCWRMNLGSSVRKAWFLPGSDETILWSVMCNYVEKQDNNIGDLGNIHNHEWSYYKLWNMVTIFNQENTNWFCKQLFI